MRDERPGRGAHRPPTAEGEASMATRQSGRTPDFGDSERYDRIAHTLRRGALAVLIPALAIAAFFWTSPDVAVRSVVLRALIVYGFVLLVMRLAGKRTLSEMSTFDLVVVLIISEAIQPAMTADDTRMTTAALLVLTILAADAILGLLKDKSQAANRLLDDVPTVLIKDGQLRRQAMARERIDEDDILEAARENLGLHSLDQIRFALLERTGGISVIPWASESTPRAR
jgi:uncharacterized membrane protein YcaP (DUF421 family)